jgi:ABC-type antimicrobial peptide transport system permease subunit
MATFNIARRTKEIGIRRVFGASIMQSLALLVNEFSRVFVVAAFMAVPVVWYAARRWLDGFAYHTPMPWWVFITAFAGIGILIAAIITLQGWRSVSTNPSTTLRSE